MRKTYKQENLKKELVCMCKLRGCVEIIVVDLQICCFRFVYAVYVIVAGQQNE